MNQSEGLFWSFNQSERRKKAYLKPLHPKNWDHSLSSHQDRRSTQSSKLVVLLILFYFIFWTFISFSTEWNCIFLFWFWWLGWVHFVWGKWPLRTVYAPAEEKCATILFWELIIVANISSQLNNWVIHKEEIVEN